MIGTDNNPDYTPEKALRNERENIPAYGEVEPPDDMAEPAPEVSDYRLILQTATRTYEELRLLIYRMLLLAADRGKFSVVIDRSIVTDMLLDELETTFNIETTSEVIVVHWPKI